MDYYARRTALNNNRNPPILLNKDYFSRKYISSEFSKNNLSRIIPSYSGNPHLLNNNKVNFYSSTDFGNINKSKLTHIRELINSKFKINNNDNYTSKYNNNYFPKYPKYKETSNNFNNKSINVNNYNKNLSPSVSQKEYTNTNLQSQNIRKKIWTLSNGHPKKSLIKNYSMEYIPSKKYNTSLSTKKKLILDLDETLVHSGFNPFTRQSDISLQINIDGRNHTINILKRPYVDEFLKEISNYFDIYVFTASMEEYASPVIDILDKNHVVKGKFFRQDCLFENDLYIKDLYKVTNDLKDVIIIDNNPSSYATNEDNGIPIKTWYDDLDDNELPKLIPILKYLSNVPDVRSIIRQIINRRINEVDFYIVNQVINGNNNNYPIYNNNGNKVYENNFYHEINESKSQLKDIDNINKNNYQQNDNENYYTKFDRYKKYNNINSFSNMSYNEIQNESIHTIDNNNFNNYNNEGMKFNQNHNENIYQKSSNKKNYQDQNNLERKMNYESVNDLNNKYRNYINNNNNDQINQNNNQKIRQNIFYGERTKDNRPFTPNINRRKINSFFDDVIENDAEREFINGYKTNSEYNENENKNDNYYNKRIDYEQFSNGTYDNNVYNRNNDIKTNTQNILNRSSSDIYVNIRKDDNLKKYNYLLNMNKNERKREEENNENNNNNDYYLESYKQHLLRINNRTSDYIKNNLNNNIIKSQNSNIRINYSNNLGDINKTENNFDNFPNKMNDYYTSNINNNKYKINPNLAEEKYERYNYNNQNINRNINNKRDYLDDLYQFRKQINLRFTNFRNFVNDKRRNNNFEENKSRNLEDLEKYEAKIDNYVSKNYLDKNNIRKYNFSMNNNNYLERTNLQNLINEYRNKYNAFEKSINKNHHKSILNKTFSVDKNNYNYKNDINRYFNEQSNKSNSNKYFYSKIMS